MTGTLHKDIRTFIVSCSILVTIRNVSDSSVEKIKTFLFCPTTFSKNPIVYEIMCKIIVGPYRTKMTVWRMRIACCGLKIYPQNIHLLFLCTV